MKKKEVTLRSKTFHCNSCNQDFKSTDGDRKECAMCESTEIQITGDSSITAEVFDGEEYDKESDI